MYFRILCMIPISETWKIDEIEKMGNILKEDLKCFNSRRVEYYDLTVTGSLPNDPLGCWRNPLVKRARYKEEKIKRPCTKDGCDIYICKSFEVYSKWNIRKINAATEDNYSKVIGNIMMNCLERMKYPKRTMKDFEKEEFNAFVRIALMKNGYL